MVSLTTLSASCDSSASTNGVSHDPKSHIAHHFDHLDLTNAMVPYYDTETILMASNYQKSYVMNCFNHHEIMNLMVLLTMLLVSYNTDAIVKWLKSHVAPHFDHIDQINVLLRMPSVLCDTNTGITWPKRSHWASFQPSQTNKLNGAIDNAISIMWCWHLCQQHHMTKRVMSYLVSIVFT